MADARLGILLSADTTQATQALQTFSIGVANTEKNLTSLQRQIAAFGGGVKSFKLPSFEGIKPIPSTLTDSLGALNTAVTTTDLTWRQFVGQRMGTYMKQLGSHGAAIKQIAEEWRNYKAGLETVIPTANDAAAAIGKLQTKAQAGIKLPSVTAQSIPPIKVTADATQATRELQIFSIGVTTTERNLSVLQKQLLAFGGGVRSFQSNFSKIPTAVSSTSNALTKFNSTASASNLVLINTGRVFQDLPFGILGIANNINPLIESFQRLSLQAKETGVSVGRSLLQSLTGAGGLGFAFSIISAAAIFASQGLAFFTRGMGSSGKAAGDAAREIRSVGDVIGDAFASTQSDIARVNALAKAATDSSNSFRIQKNAIEELKKINKDYFGDLEAGKSTYEQITKATQDYTKALVQQAIVKGLQEEIGELAKQLRSAAKEYGSLFTATTQAKENLAKVNREQATNVQGLTAQNREVNLARNTYNSLNAQLVKSSRNLNSLQSDFDNLTREINKAVLKEVDLDKFGDKGPKKIKKTVDDTIEQAKRLEKQFGELNIFPKLDEDFATSLAQVKKNAQDVLTAFSTNQKPLTAKFKLQPVLDIIDPKVDLLEFSKEVTDKFEKAQSFLLKLKPTIQLEKTTIDIEKLRGFANSFNRLGDAFGNEFANIFLNTVQQNLEKGFKIDKAIRSAGIETKFLEASFNALDQSANQFFDAILDGQNVFKSFGSFIKNVFKQIAAEILKTIALAAILQLLTGGKAGGFKSLGKVLGFAGGGSFEAGKPMIVGEKGPELIVPKLAGTVIPNTNISSFRNIQQAMQVEVIGRLAGNDILLSNARTAGRNRRNS